MGKRKYKKCSLCKGEIKNRLKNAKYHKSCYEIIKKQQQRKLREERKLNKE